MGLASEARKVKVDYFLRICYLVSNLQTDSFVDFNSSIPGAVTSIGCFVCSSEAGSDRLCEDSFDNFNSFHYRDTCMASMKGRSAHSRHGSLLSFTVILIMMTCWSRNLLFIFLCQNDGSEFWKNPDLHFQNSIFCLKAQKIALMAMIKVFLHEILLHFQFYI